jgi:ABC-type multidrug transport system fused ATPase/permease subunit
VVRGKELVSHKHFTIIQKFLVFDEVTSTLDGLTEKSVTHAIKKLARKNTIIIANRIGTVKNCDQIV